MTRYVKQIARDLDAEQVGHLWDLINASRNSAETFFNVAKASRDQVKYGHSGELGSLDEPSRVIVNLAHAHIKSKAPTLFFKDPTVNVQSLKKDQLSTAPIWNALLNGTIKKIGFKKEAKKTIKDCLIYGEGWLKVGMNRADPNLLTGSNRKAKKDVVGPEIEGGAYTGPTEWLSKEAPFIARLSPMGVIVDYASPDRSLERARFVDIMYIKTHEELLNDPKYTIPDDMKSSLANKSGNVYDGGVTYGSRSPVTTGNITEIADFDVLNGTGPDTFVIIHEVWVYQIVELKLYKQLVVLVEGVEQDRNPAVIRKIEGRIPEWKEVIGDNIHSYPLVRLTTNDIPDSFPNSDIAVWSSLHSAVNWLVSRLVQKIKDSKDLYEVNKGALGDDVDAIRKIFQGSASRDIIPVTAVGAVNPIQNNQTTRDEGTLMTVVLEMIRRVSGQSETKLGGDKFRTATAAADAARSDAIKTDEETDTVSDFLKEAVFQIARIIFNIIQEDRDASYVMQVTGETGDVDWINFSASEINWLPDIMIEVDSFKRPTKEETAQKGLMALQALLGTLPAGVAAKPEVLLRQIFEALDIRNVDKILDNSTDQMLLQAVEMTLLLNGQNVPINPEDNDNVHVKTIDMFLNSPTAQQVQQVNPQAMDSLLQHRDAHAQRLQASQNQVPGADTGKINIFEQSGNPTPANQARADTAREREAAGIQSLPGNAGQL